VNYLFYRSRRNLKDIIAPLKRVEQELSVFRDRRLKDAKVHEAAAFSHEEAAVKAHADVYRASKIISRLKEIDSA
jgi:hypothetical protein